MKIHIFSHFVRIPYETSNDRFVYLGRMLQANKHEVTLVTSTFDHDHKKQKGNNKFNEFKIIELFEPGYKKNISFSRIFSHKKFAREVKKYLSKLEEKPDVIYVAIPSLGYGEVLLKYCKKNNIKFIVDVQDIWPEAFKLVFNPRGIAEIIYAPICRKADKIYSGADALIAVSETYLKRAAEKSHISSERKISVFLGTDLSNFDSIIAEEKSDQEFVLAYCGTLGASYNVCDMIKAIKFLQDKRKDLNIKMLVMGTGEKLEELKQQSISVGINAEFTGFIKYDEMVRKLKSADIGLNPINKGAAQSIINKVGEYAAAGLPVINTQECLEYRNVVDKLRIGINCDNGNIEQIAFAIEYLIDNKKDRLEMGNNNRNWAEEKFDRSLTYSKIVSIIENI